MLLAVAAVLLGAMAVTVKVLSGELPSHEVAFIRFAGGLVLVVALALTGRAPLALGRKRLLVLRGVLSGIAVLCFFAAIQRIPVGTAVTLNTTYPIFATVLSVVLGRERWRWDVACALVLAFAGVVLVVDPSLGGLGIGYLYGIASGLVAGATVLVVKDLRATESAQSIFLSFSAVGAAISAPFLRSDWVTPGPEAVPVLVLMVLLASAGQLLMSHGFKYTTVSRGTILLFLSVLVSAVLGHFLFGDRYGWKFAVGAAFILGTSAYVNRKGALDGGEPVG